MNPQLNSQRPLRPHQGDVGVPQLDGGLRVMTLDEQKGKRKKSGLCPTCGEVRTHKPGIWKSLIPDTVEGIVYKGICLNCSTLDAAKMKLGEPIIGSFLPDDMNGNTPKSRRESCPAPGMEKDIAAASAAYPNFQSAPNVTKPQQSSQSAPNVTRPQNPQQSRKAASLAQAYTAFAGGRTFAKHTLDVMPESSELPASLTSAKGTVFEDRLRHKLESEEKEDVADADRHKNSHEVARVDRSASTPQMNSRDLPARSMTTKGKLESEGKEDIIDAGRHKNSQKVMRVDLSISTPPIYSSELRGLPLHSVSTKGTASEERLRPALEPEEEGDDADPAPKKKTEKPSNPCKPIADDGEASHELLGTTVSWSDRTSILSAGEQKSCDDMGAEEKFDEDPLVEQNTNGLEDKHVLDELTRTLLTEDADSVQNGKLEWLEEQFNEERSVEENTADLNDRTSPIELTSVVSAVDDGSSNGGEAERINQEPREDGKRTYGSNRGVGWSQRSAILPAAETDSSPNAGLAEVGHSDPSVKPGTNGWNGETRWNELTARVFAMKDGSSPNQTEKSGRVPSDPVVEKMEVVQLLSEWNNQEQGGGPSEAQAQQDDEPPGDPKAIGLADRDFASQVDNGRGTAEAVVIMQDNRRQPKHASIGPKLAKSDDHDDGYSSDNSIYSGGNMNIGKVINIHHSQESKVQDIGSPQFNVGSHDVVLNEEKEKRKKGKFCPTCGEVQTHKPALWKSNMPETIEGLVYKGICLKCNSLATVKLKLGEPLTDCSGVLQRSGSSIHQTEDTTDSANSIPNKSRASVASSFQASATTEQHSDSGRGQPSSQKSASKPFFQRSLNLGTKEKRPKPLSQKSAAMDGAVEIASTIEGSHDSLQVKSNVIFVNDDGNSITNKFTETSAATQQHSDSGRGQKSASKPFFHRSLNLGTKEKRPKPLSQKSAAMDGTVEHASTVEGSHDALQVKCNLNEDLTNANDDGNSITNKFTGSVGSFQTSATTEPQLGRVDDSSQKSSSKPLLQRSLNVGNTEKRYSRPLFKRSSTDSTFGTFGTHHDLEGYDFNNGKPKNEATRPLFQRNLSAPSFEHASMSTIKSSKKAKRLSRSIQHTKEMETNVQHHPNQPYSPVTSEVHGFHSSDPPIQSCSPAPEVHGFNYSDPCYSGRTNEQDQPHGKGDMDYDDDHIAKGIQSNGVLVIKDGQDGKMGYEPYLLPGYSIGDVGRKYDMMNTSREARVVAVSKLCAGDCAFVRRSNGSYTYAIVKSRSDEGDITITFQVDSRGLLKTFRILQWGDVHLPVKPDSLPGFSAGDVGRQHDMMIEFSGQATIAASKLRVGDAAFVRRSNGSWRYSIVKDRTDKTMTFQVDKIGSYKIAKKRIWGVHVRRIKKKNRGATGPTEEDAKAYFKLIEKAQEYLRSQNASFLAITM